jgi:hypothetical protein
MARRLINSLTVIIIVLLVMMKAKDLFLKRNLRNPSSPEAATDTVSHYVPVEDGNGGNGNQSISQFIYFNNLPLGKVITVTRGLVIHRIHKTHNPKIKSTSGD